MLAGGGGDVRRYQVASYLYIFGTIAIYSCEWITVFLSIIFIQFLLFF